VANHNVGEAEASARRAIELGNKYPKYAGGYYQLGYVGLEKGDWDGAGANFRAAIAIQPDAAGLYFNLAVTYVKRGDLAEAAKWLQKALALDPTWEEAHLYFADALRLTGDLDGAEAETEKWYRKAVARDPANAHYREVLDGIVQKRAKLVRQEEVAAGRAKPATPAEAIECAELAYRPPRRRYVAAVKLYCWALAPEHALSDDFRIRHSYKAACIALRAAAGQDEEMTAFGVEEWGYLTGLALKWLRANLVHWTSQAKDPKRRQEARDQLTHWKNEPDLAPVRDPSWLAAMPPADRKAWEALWRDVDALLASIGPNAGSKSAKP
jgi:tetratricopeptide (TPR) repeat protein